MNFQNFGELLTSCLLIVFSLMGNFPFSGARVPRVSIKLYQKTSTPKITHNL